MAVRQGIETNSLNFSAKAEGQFPNPRMLQAPSYKFKHSFTVVVHLKEILHSVLAPVIFVMFFIF